MSEQPPKTSKTGHFGINQAIKIFPHMQTVLRQFVNGTGHVTVLSTPPRKMEYSGVHQHCQVFQCT